MGRSFATLLFVLGVGLPELIQGEEATSTPPATPVQIHQTVERAIGYLQSESGNWLKTRKCAACHHAPLALWALSEADRKGYPIDKSYLTETVDSLLGSHEKLLGSRIFPNPDEPPDPRPQGRGLNMGLPFLVVAARALPELNAGEQESLKRITEEIINKQQPDGSWEFFATLRRPPINETQLTDAVWILLALQGEINPESPEKEREALAKGIAWWKCAKSSGIHQEKVLQLWYQIRTGESAEVTQVTVDELLVLQRADGGWSQTIPELKSDAYATGQTLYVLSLSGHTAAEPQIQRGIDFLVTTQLPEGSWPMDSRSTPNGEPGSAKLLTPITCAASSWATLGLVSLVPKGP